MPTEPTSAVGGTPRATKFSLAANYDPELVPALASYPVDEVYGKFPTDGISSGRPRYLATPVSEEDLRRYPGIRYVLIHSLAHALMRQITLECGYTAASIRERIYCRGAAEEYGPMSGILLYTAASDSEGTLGGLVQLGQPQPLGRLLDQALEEMRICGSDPLCAEHNPTGDGRGVHGACCHACLFAPETSCEKGNRFLDRAALVQTFAGKGAAYFT